MRHYWTGAIGFLVLGIIALLVSFNDWYPGIVPLVALCLMVALYYSRKNPG